MDTLRRRTAHVHTLLPELSLKPFVRLPLRRDERRDRIVDGEGRLMPFIHWAGCGFPTMVRPEIFLHYRTLGMAPGERLRYRARFYPLRWKRQTGNFLRRIGMKK
jgi:hypothetical protein